MLYSDKVKPNNAISEKIMAVKNNTNNLGKDMIEAKGFAIQIYTENFKNDYISLTDIAKYKSDKPFIVINNCLRNKDNIQFSGLR